MPASQRVPFPVQPDQCEPQTSFPGAWKFRRYEVLGNKTVYKQQIVGPVTQLSRRKTLGRLPPSSGSIVTKEPNTRP